MRWFALYLPQFHEIEENNNWWGKGFTEWTHVNAAKPLYKGHHQPISPLNNNYYNLMDKETVKWQTQLMKDYRVDGMIYYHYYFNGKKIMEKPAENLLKWTDIEQPFFFCWANHTWYKATDEGKKVLIEQTYGTKEDWEEHFKYLLSFFKDPRYEKKDNKPLLMLYDPFFLEKHDMMDYFEQRCKDEGFDGIYIIESFGNYTQKQFLDDIKSNRCSQTEKIFVREPAISNGILLRKRLFSPLRPFRKIKTELAKKGIGRPLPIYNGSELYKIMLKESPRGKDFLHGIFFAWDNTPRHGKRGYIITPPNKKAFMNFVDSIREEDYVFINAWNEWAEGMVLEPTAHEGYKYLEWIKEWKENNEKAN